jgi:hypothetical protein
MRSRALRRIVAAWWALVYLAAGVVFAGWCYGVWQHVR